MSIEKYSGSFRKETSGVTQIPTKTLQSITNHQALGVYVYLASKPDDWEINPYEIKNHFNIGRDRVYKLLNYLIENGWLERVIHKNAGQVVEVEYILYLWAKRTANSGSAPLPCFPDPAFPDPENKDYTKHRDKQNIEITDGQPQVGTPSTPKNSKPVANTVPPDSQVAYTPATDEKIKSTNNLSNDFYVMVLSIYHAYFPEATKHNTTPVSKKIRQAINRAINNFEQWTDYPFTIENLDVLWQRYTDNNPGMGRPYLTKRGNYNNNTICTFLTENAIQDALDDKKIG